MWRASGVEGVQGRLHHLLQYPADWFVAGTKAAKETKALTNLSGVADNKRIVFLLFEAHSQGSCFYLFVCLFLHSSHLRYCAADAEREKMKETLRYSSRCTGTNLFVVARFYSQRVNACWKLWLWLAARWCSKSSSTAEMFWHAT